MRCSNNINTITIIDLMNNRTLFLLMLIGTGWIESLPAWTVLDPYRYESAEGATLLKESDHSLFSAGKRPEKDTYTVSVRTSLPRLTAIRIDLIADDRLPSSGPDRQENGNLHLNELIFSAKPLGARSSLKRVTLRAARADFNQTNWEISKSIDGNPGTAWGIHPRVGQSHSAIYMLEKPLSSETRFELIFKLAQFHGDGHLVGHFRLGAIDVEEPDTQAIDPRLQRVSTTLSGKRTREQLLELAGLYMNWSLKRVMSTLPERKRLYCGTNQFTAVGGHRPAETPRAIQLFMNGGVSQNDTFDYKWELKQRGMLEDTLVVWSTEFGRMPFTQGEDGRDHNGGTFVTWMAGAGVRGGTTYGEGDDFGYQRIKDRTYCYDLHATLLHLLGVDHTRLTFRHNGFDRRLTDVHGQVVHQILN
jgi:hypothetical protein